MDSNPTITLKNSAYDMHVMGVVSAESGNVSEIGVVLAAGEYTSEQMLNGTARTVKLIANKAANGKQFVYTIKNIANKQVRTAMVYAVIDGVTYYSDITCVAKLSIGDYGGDQIIDQETPDPFDN